MKRLGLLLVVSAINLAGCSETQTTDPRARCVEARAAMVDTRLASQFAAATPELRVEIEKHRTSLVRSLGDEFLERCSANGPAYANCIVNAADSESQRRCDADLR